MVYDENNNPVGNAVISVAGINHDVTSGMEISYFLYKCLYLFLFNHCRIGKEVIFVSDDVIMFQTFLNLILSLQKESWAGRVY